MFLKVRPAQTTDAKVIRQILEEAFKGKEEADLVEDLRLGHLELLELVAQEVNTVCGEILFSPVSIRGVQLNASGVGLGPMAVTPARQRDGIGKALVAEGLKRLKERGIGYVVVLGDPAYYQKFGFVPAHAYGLTSEFAAPPDAFQVLSFNPDGSLPPGQVIYGREFDRFKAQ